MFADFVSRIDVVTRCVPEEFNNMVIFYHLVLDGIEPVVVNIYHIMKTLLHQRRAEDEAEN